jgi:hypothetical protein
LWAEGQGRCAPVATSTPHERRTSAERLLGEPEAMMLRLAVVDLSPFAIVRDTTYCTPSFNCRGGGETRRGGA